MNDSQLKNVEGRWYLQFSGSPFWQKDDFSIITFNYTLIHKGEELVLEDRVEYMRNGMMRFRLGYDYPVEEFLNTFRWKGVGINRFFRNRFEISIINPEYMVIFYEKTVLSPACLDIVTREKTPGAELEDRIFREICASETLCPYLQNVEKIQHS